MDPPGCRSTSSQRSVLRRVVEEFDRPDPPPVDDKELRKSHPALREIRVVEDGGLVAGADPLKEADWRLQSFDKPPQSSDEPRGARAVACDRAFEVKVLGEDRPNASLVEPSDPVPQPVVVRVDQLGRLGLSKFHGLYSAQPRLPLLAGIQLSRPGSIPLAADPNRAR